MELKIEKDVKQPGVAVSKWLQREVVDRQSVATRTLDAAPD
jgi:hypothetical protein